MTEYYNYFESMIGAPNVLGTSEGKALMAKVEDLIAEKVKFYHPDYARAKPAGEIAKGTGVKLSGTALQQRTTQQGVAL